MAMTYDEFNNGLRVLLCINCKTFLECINPEDREFVGDNQLWDRFVKNPYQTFLNLPTQDSLRLFDIIETRNTKAGLSQ